MADFTSGLQWAETAGHILNSVWDALNVLKQVYATKCEAGLMVKPKCSNASSFYVRVHFSVINLDCKWSPLDCNVIATLDLSWQKDSACTIMFAFIKAYSQGHLILSIENWALLTSLLQCQTVRKNPQMKGRPHSSINPFHWYFFNTQLLPYCTQVVVASV